MKIRVFIFLFFIANCSWSLAQVGNYSRGLEYLGEDVETSMLFMDVAVNNYNNNPVSAVGVYRTERVFHYSSSHRYGETIYMILMFHQISSIEYSEYFIFDKFQNLVNYVYISGDVVLKFKIDDNTVIAESEMNKQGVTENYFIPDHETYFNFESIRERCNSEFLYCTSVTGIPNYENEIIKIRDVYKKINSDPNLRIERSDELVKYYKDDELLKMVFNLDRTYEYYFDNGFIVFAFVNAGDDLPEQRIYCYRSEPFKLLYGKENLVKEEEDFWSFSNKILGVYRDYISGE